MNEAGNEFAAPLGSVNAGRLEFARGAYNVTIQADASTADLCRARFEGTAPDIRVEDGAVRISYPRSWNPFDWRGHSAGFALNTAVPWEVEVREGASRIDADLSGVQLESFEVDGGVSDVELTLPEPSEDVSVRIEGGAHNLKVRRPGGVAARLHVQGWASKLAFDGQHLGAVGGETTLESGGYADATDRYEVVIAGGASNVSVLTT